MPPPDSPTPVLLHGFLGCASHGPMEYFRGVERELRANGIIPLIPSLPPAGTIAQRATALARVLENHPGSRFALIGHSMGGLDGRYLIANLDPDHRVVALTTVATPHQGTPVAGNMLDGRGPVSMISRRFWKAPLTDLMPVTRQNEVIPNRAGVVYRSYAACRPDSEMPSWLKWITGPIPARHDGLVPVASAMWGDFRGVSRADHFEVVGWSFAWPNQKTARPFDHMTFWRQIVAEVIDQDEA